MVKYTVKNKKLTLEDLGEDMLIKFSNTIN